jgi:hypothetical protein
VEGHAPMPGGRQLDTCQRGQLPSAAGLAGPLPWCVSYPHPLVTCCAIASLKRRDIVHPFSGDVKDRGP